MTMSKSFHYMDVYTAIKGVITAYAVQSVQGADVDDLISGFMFEVWLDCDQHKRKFEDKNHAERYFIRKFKNYVIDYIRSRNRHTKLVQDYALHFVDDCNDSVYEIYSDLICSAGVLYGETGKKLMALKLEGRTSREIESITGVPYRTVCYKVEKSVAHMSHDERLPCEEGRTRNDGRCGNQMEEVVMATVKKVKKVAKSAAGGMVCAFADGKTNRVNVLVNEKLVAVARVIGTTISTVSLKVKDVDKDQLVESITSFLSASKPAAGEEKGSGAPGTPKAKKAKTPVAKENKPAVNPTEGKAIKKGVALDGLEDVPATVEEWQAKCGGEGYCLGGSGQPVARRFRPGFDAKLKSCLRRLSTPNAKKLAKELGWTDKIAWQK